MSYITPAEFLKRYDARRVGELVKDDNTQATATQLNTDANLAAALDDASGMIEASALTGGKYTAADLAAFSGNAQKLLYRLTADLAYGLLVQRRGYNAADQQTLAPSFAQALKLLGDIESGKWVFPTDAAVAATKPKRAQLSTDVTLVTGEASRYFALPTNPDGSIR